MSSTLPEISSQAPTDEKIVEVMARADFEYVNGGDHAWPPTFRKAENVRTAHRVILAALRAAGFEVVPMELIDAAWRCANTVNNPLDVDQLDALLDPWREPPTG